MKKRLLGVFTAIIAMGTVSTCFAFDEIRPTLALSSDQYHALSTYKEYAQGIIDGNGAKLTIGYTSSIPLNAYIAVIEDNGTYNPADLYQFALPAAHAGAVIVDLTALSTWSPGSHSYSLSFLSDAEHTDATFNEMTFVPGGVADTVGAATKGIFQIEPFWVSSAHILRGYRILDVPFSIILGCTAILVAVMLLVWKRKTSGIAIALMVMLVGIFLYDIRFVGDLTIFSVDHTKHWLTDGTYGEAQDLYTAASMVKEEAKKGHAGSISVCFDSTDYYAKLLRYFVYPMHVTMTGALKADTAQVLVTHKLTWSYDGNILHCDSINAPATLVKDFADGSHLYLIHKKS
jgi:hypothetical protein